MLPNALSNSPGMTMELSLHLDLSLGEPEAIAHPVTQCHPLTGLVDGGPARRTAPLTICLLLSLTVHALLFLFRSAPPDTPPMVIMEISMMALGGPQAGMGDGPGGPAGAPGPETGHTTQPVTADVVPPVPTRAQTADMPSEVTPEAPRPARPAVHRKSTAKPHRVRPDATPRAPQHTPPRSEQTEIKAVDQPAAGQTPASVATAATGANPLREAGAGTGRGTGQGTGSGAGTGTGEGRPFNFGDANGPAFLHRVRPVYPPLARARHEQGTVVVLLHIDARGRLQQARVLTSAGPRLDQAALHAVQASTFKPASRNGQSFACFARLPIRFILKS